MGEGIYRSVKIMTQLWYNYYAVLSTWLSQEVIQANAVSHEHDKRILQCLPIELLAIPSDVK